jgi:antitoxin (DNA-binding transcriptional repressor) of toxin-antitoxin stability system
MTTLLSEAKAHLSELVGKVHDHHERVIVTVHDRPSELACNDTVSAGERAEAVARRTSPNT